MLNNKKLQLIQEATAAFPGTPVNSAIWYYLKDRFTGITVAELISKYLRDIRWVYNFDGVDDRGQLAFRAINPDGDIDIEWRQDAIAKADGSVIVSQCGTGVNSTQEFRLTRIASGDLEVIVGGSLINITVAQGYTAIGTFRFTLVGTALRIFRNGILTHQTTFTRGTAREPNAVTLIGARPTGTSNFLNFYRGFLSDVRINGVLWPIGDRNQQVQLPSPSGLGPELITQSVLENPAIKGDHWTYLGDGRWQYVGDGSANTLRFLTSAAHPSAGFLEFEVESFSGEGQMRCSASFAPANQVGNVFSGVGRKRYFYTVFDTSVMVEFQRYGAGQVVSCIIKNISFKPLWVASATELVTNGDFSNGTSGWSAFSGGSLAVTNSQGVLTTSGAGSRFERGVTLEAGSYYQVSMDVVALVGSTLARLTLMRGPGGNYSTIGSASLSATGKISFIVLASAADSIISIGGDNVNSGTITVDNISVRKLDSLCNPLTLANTASTGWQEIEA